MEEIFYAALALRIAGKAVNAENIKAVLEAAGTQVDESALEAVATFIDHLEHSRCRKEKAVDPRILSFLSLELKQRVLQSERLRALVDELSEVLPQTYDLEEDFVASPLPWKLPQKVARDEAKTLPEEQSLRKGLPTEEATPVTSMGLYVYGVAPSKEATSFGPIGIEGNDVYTISYKDLCAIVHNCPAEPYTSDDDELVKEWIKAHQSVLDEAKGYFSAIVPMGFDTVLRPKDASSSPEQTVREWLKDEHDRLIAMIEKVRGKDEYGVQIFYDPEIIKLAVSQNEELQKMKDEMASKPPGVAYMYKQKLENIVKAEAERLVDRYLRDFYEKIKCHCDAVVLEKNKKAGSGKVMLLNLSCLVSQNKVDALGEELDKINAMEGFSVRFTGPWPPYSFVSEPKKEEGSKA